MLDEICRTVVGDEAIPKFGRSDAPLDLHFVDQVGEAIRLRGFDREHATLSGDRAGTSGIRLYPHSNSSFFQLDGDDRAHMVRVAKGPNGEPDLSVGSRLLSAAGTASGTPTPSFWTELPGYYIYPPFGMVEVVLRGGRLFLDYGVVYECELEPLGDLCFRQLSGPCRLEVVRFERSEISNSVDRFVLNDMMFRRHARAIL